MKSNILTGSLPTHWHGYKVNTGFHIGIQIALLMEDETLNERTRTMILLELLFGNDDGSIREMPEDEDEILECLSWFMGGWNQDNVEGSISEKKFMDYDIDQGRIYADFLQIYGIDLEQTTMHWWKFQWLLWNMPHGKSSFLQTIEIRNKKPSKNAGKEERDAIKKAQKVYGLQQKEKPLSETQINKIDGFDSFMEKIHQNK